MKKIASLVSIMAIFASIAACNKESSNDGSKEVSELKAMLLDNEGEIVFTETSVAGLYSVGVESRETAAELAGIYAGTTLSGDTCTRTIPGGNGTVKVAKGENGVFYTVDFAVVSIPSFTLDIEDINKENNNADGNKGTRHKCPICKKEWTGKSSVCPWTSKHPQP